MERSDATILGIDAIHNHNLTGLKNAIRQGAYLRLLLETAIKEDGIDMIKEILK